MIFFEQYEKFLSQRDIVFSENIGEIEIRLYDSFLFSHLPFNSCYGRHHLLSPFLVDGREIRLIDTDFRQFRLAHHEILLNEFP